MPSVLQFDRQQVRTIRLAAQGLANVPGQPVATVVARSGFVRTLGGCDAYLAVRARQRTLRRAEVDGAVERSELQVVPAARGCMYLVPRADVPLCLRFADQMSRARNERDQERAGIQKGEVEQLAELAFAVLKKQGPLTTDALRKALPEGAVRSLGERGKKVGVSSPLPGALRWLEFAGRIERKPEGGRVDTERYLWRAAQKSPFVGSKLPDEPARLHALLLERFVAHAGLATLADFCAWSGLSQRDARAARAHSSVEPAAIAGSDEEAMTTPAVAELLRMAPAVAAATAFLPFEDNLVHLYSGPAHLVADEHLSLALPSWNAADKPTTLGAARYLSLRGLIADGQLSGFWEYDPDARVAVPRCFRKPSKAAQVQIEELSAAVSTFLSDDIGHGHSFSLDSDDELRKRLQQLAAIGGDKRAAAGKVVARSAKGRAVRRPAAKPAAASKRGKAAAPAKPGQTANRTVKLPRPIAARSRSRK